MKSETLTKVIVILFMLIFVIILGTTAYGFTLGYYNQIVTILHVIAGSLFLIILPIHIYLRREKLKKLLIEFISILMSRKAQPTCTNHALLKTFKMRSFMEFCTLLDLNINSTLEFLAQKHISILKNEDSLEKIAKENGNDPLKIFALMIENHIRIKKENDM
ncbi:MAG: hypothetical protein PHO27_01310 [Sulfuricurvum sp.]|nr:hypothetical protein [Sulfuricurvum sp.]